MPGARAARPQLDWLVARPIAHRGLHGLAAGLVENSGAAALAAIEAGFGIECDVQISADGEAMVFHDFVLDRLTEESGPVAARTAAALNAMTFKGSNDPILPLAAFLDLVGGRVPLVIEVKSRFDGHLALTRRTAALVAERPWQPIVIKSFDPQVIAALRMIAPQIPRGIVGMNAYDYGDYAGLSVREKNALANLLHFSETQPDFLSWKVSDLESAAPYLCRNAVGLPLMSWTVRTPEQREAAERHADQMVFEGFRP